MHPTSETELSDILRDTNDPVRILGGGTRPIGPLTGDAVTVSGINGITLYDPGALTLVARAGTPLDEIETVLAGENQRLAFEPMDHRPMLGTTGTPTIGGVVAANVSGPRRVSVGACRDHMLGLRFVDGRGQIISNGGRVMKNVTGYDLVKLLTGSHGTLGVITEVSLKVLPRQEVSTLIVSGVQGAVALDAMTRAMNSPFEVTGAAWRPDDSGTVYLRVEGMEASRSYRAEALTKRLTSLGNIRVETEPEANRTLWQALRDVPQFGAAEAVWRVSMKPSALMTGLLPALMRTATFDHQIDWAGGLCWVGMQKGGDAAALHHALQAGVTEHGGGHATLVKGPEALCGMVPVFQPQPAPLAAIARGLRQKFDPRGILNPGLMD